MIDLNEQDATNRIRALELESFIVEAPAGAGKTELLTQRYLKLLETVEEPEEIIALTFTNKAATEMRNRILLSLTHAEQQTPETKAHKLITRGLAEKALDKSNMKQWQILSQPSRLRILTIDALCSSLTRQMPLLSRFGGQPVVSDDTDTHYNDAARHAIAEIMHETKTDDTVTTALRYMDNNAEKLTELLAKMLARRDQWSPMVGRLQHLAPEAMLTGTEQALRSLIADDLQAALQVLPDNVQNALMPLARFAASNLDSDADIAPLLDWQYTLSADADDLIMWQALANLLLTKTDKTYRINPNKNNGFPADKEHKSKKDDFTDIMKCLEHPEVVARVLSLPSIATLAESQQVILALTELLVKANAHLWLVFQAAGEVDFVEIARSAQQALENEHGATDLALQLDYKISHLLIDEFQDTSPVQMDLIKKLIEGWQPNEGRTLFCVGDPMQSIYRFRKADVSLFLQASKSGIGHLPLTRLQLSRNNRSQPAVVDWINAAFKQIFPAVDNDNQGAISYREFIASRTSIADEGVFVHPLIVDDATKKTEDEDATDPSSNNNVKQLEANYVAKLITQLQAKNSAAQKIAVLVRSRNHLKELVSEIRRNHAHLNFQAVEIEQLNERQTVQDALSLTCVLHHRADRTHWLNVLRAPWCGLTLADLHVLAANNHKDIIWSAMHDEAPLQKLSADGLLRLNHVKSVLTSAFERQGRLPVRRWLESTWLQLGGGKCLVDAGDNRDVQVFFDLVEKISRSGHLDIAALELAMQKLYAKPAINDGNVQFLTIHKSKGLEFDTVILPALNRPPRPSDNELVLWQEVNVGHQKRLLAAPHYVKGAGNKNTTANIYSYIKSLEKIRESNELVRLLYVAATRTERQLHLIASVQVNKDGEIKPAANTLLQTLWPAVEAEFKQATPQPANSTSSALDIKQFKSQLQRLDSSEFAGDFLQVAIQHGLKKQSHPPVFADQVNAPASFTSTLTEMDFYRHCGILAHLYMELMANSAQSWTAPRLAQCQPAMQKWLMQQGYATKLAEQGATEVETALQATLSSEAGQWVLKNHSEAVSELSLMQATEGEVKKHVIDRTFVENGTRWIVDYKLTNLEVGLELKQAAELHRPQLVRYASLFAGEGLPIKAAVLFLSAGQLVELPLSC